jgi:soluble lytic murein transglycosylase
MAVLLVLTACTLNQVPPTPVYQIVTPEPTATPTGPTPTPTIVPTPTTEPVIALTGGDQAFLNGYYEEAVSAYAEVLRQEAAPEDLRAEAAFHMGQAALREGMFEAAVEPLSILIEDYPDSESAAQAYVLRGDARMGLAQWSAAVEDYQTYLTLRPGLMDDYAYERIGDAQLALGQQSNALASYAQAAAASRSLDALISVRQRMAQIYISNGNVDVALAQHEAILALAQTDSQLASTEASMANVLLEAGRTEESMNHLRRIFIEYPEQPEAYDAMLALIANGFEPEPLEQASVAFLHGDYEYTISVLNTFTTTHQLAAIPPDLYMRLGRAYREIGNPTAAITAFQTIIAQYPQDLLFGEALLEQGQTKAQSGDTPAAIQHYVMMADNYGYLPEAAEALWRAGYLYGTNGQPQESRDVFQRLADAYPNTAQARSGLFLAAAQAVTAGDLAGAEVLYGQLALSTTGDDQAGAYFSTARLALQRGDTRTAQNAFQAATAAAPESYFAARTQDIATGREPFAPPANYRFEFDEDTAMTEAEAWLKAHFSIEQEGALWPLSDTLAGDARLLRGQALWDVGADAEANKEFEALVDAYQADALASFQLAVYMQTAGAYPQSIVAAANVIRAANVGTLDAPPLIARMRYPVYYADVVLAEAEEYDLDPLLLFALIRSESLFDSTLTDAARARGLTQIIPVTGEYVAAELNWPDYQPNIVFRPYASVGFGAHHLDEQLEAFDGNTVAALAAYDAGTARAQAWRELSGDDPDLFITAITSEYTRGYVERLYSYYSIYRALYGVN